MAAQAVRSASWQGRRSRTPWGDHAPIRSELFGPERFDQHAVSLADSQNVVYRASPVVSILRRLDENSDALLKAYDATAAEVRAGRTITPAAEWLVDNYHLVEKTVRQVRQDLPAGYVRELPKLGPGFLEGHPRILGIVWAYVAHTDSLFDPDLFARYIRAYESRKALTLGELWAAAITLRLVLIENMRRVADLVLLSSDARNQADKLVDGLLGVEGRPPRPIAELVPNAATFVPSRPFATQLIRRLSGEDLAEPLEWLAERLAARGLDPDAIMREETQGQASNTVTIRNIVTSLRLVTDINWEDWIESVSLLEEGLQSDPSYMAVDFPTRNLCRSTIERLARGAGQEEIHVARAALHRAEHGQDERSRDLGYWLIGEGKKEFATSLGYVPTWRERFTQGARRAGVGGYVATLSVVTIAGLAFALWCVDAASGGLSWWTLLILALVAAIPFSDLALGLVNYWSARLFSASILPGLALREGIPDELRTMVVIPTMITSLEGIEEAVGNLEVHYLANSGGEAYFALVTDWADADVERSDDDDALLDAAVEQVRLLNERYGDRFFFFHRERRWNPGEDKWMGWERKRGKLEELNRLLRGDQNTSFIVREGLLPGRFRYVLTVDSDTVLPRECVRRLVAKIGHPLNQPVFDPSVGRVTQGYGILQPRVTPSLPVERGSSMIQQVYSTRPGLDPYAFAVSDVYQDLFDEGSFAGKGIYDIDALMAAMADRIPENSLLSHDLLEGNYCRSGLVTDIEVVEEYPTSYAVSAARTHRWVRGDWQLLPWLLRSRQNLSMLGRWKMWDNLRRSLSPIFVLLALIAGIALLSAPAALVWFLVVIGTFFLPPLVPTLADLFRRREGVTLGSQVRGRLADVRRGLALGLTNLTFISHQAWLMGDAIVRTLHRLLVSHRGLLEWTTADTAQKQAQGSTKYFFSLMWGGLVGAAILLVVALARGPWHLLVCLVPLALWFAAPKLAQLASREQGTPELTATPQDLDALRLVARRTWLFFETFVTAEENHLPPDNFQEQPQPIVAPRTSPTNIGLYMLTTLAARDFGWIGTHDTTARLEATMSTIEKMDHHRGHLFNWYDTRSLAPLEPRYVSTVDSGNLAGHLIAVANACRELSEQPDLHCRPAQGLLDALELARATLGANVPSNGATPGGSAAELRRRLDAVEATLTPLLGFPRIHGQLDALSGALEGLVVDAEMAVEDGADPELLVWVRALARSAESQRRDARATAQDQRDLLRRLARLEGRARREMHEMDFTFLFNSRRSLLSIGYQVHGGSLDSSCYDLLASEARLASFVAIAKGDVRTRHWFLLGRTVTATAGGAALLSWSGSMFEYLMPPLVMRTPPTGLLARTAAYVVRRQIEYGAELGIPWGVSESAYNARDAHLTYQYSPFGVPGLGIVRGLANNVVIAPYATGLASMIDPGAAAANYARLASLGAQGRYGFYESVDFTPSRLPENTDHAVIHCYMAHHQGMTIVAIHNSVYGGAMRDRFHAEPLVRATDLLLQERAPRDIPISHARREEVDAASGVRAFTPPVERRFTGRDTFEPAVQQMSNGDLSLTLTPAGSGQLRWRGYAITRWHPDATVDPGADVLYVRDDATGNTWSAKPMPVPHPRSRYDVRFTDERATYRRRNGGLVTELTYLLSPETDTLVRRLRIRNRRRRDRRVTVSTYSELVLAAARDDDAHPAFSKMFVHTEFLPDREAILATRRRRNPDDQEVWVAHILVTEDGALGPPVAETDRARFIGRGGDVRRPRLMRRGVKPSGTTGYVLDPVLSLTQRLKVPAQSKVELYAWTFVASSRAEVLSLLDQHRAAAAFERVGMLAWTQSQVQLRQLSATADEAGSFQTLAGHVIFPQSEMRPPAQEIARDAGLQSLLWPLSISGDLPIIMVRIEEERDIDLVRQLIRAFEYWRFKRFAVDLVILNDRATSYVQELHRTLEGLATSIRPRTGAPDSNGRVFVLRSDQTSAESLAALTASASVVLSASRGDLSWHLQHAVRHELPPAPDAPLPRGEQQEEWTPVPLEPQQPRPPDLLHDNGIGGFSPDGSEYVTVLDTDAATPAPWTNVIANEQFGFHATAEGAGYTWWRNSRDNQLTPWRNDPVSTPLSEAFYVRDDLSGRLATPTAAPIDDGRHVARHGFGYTRYEHTTPELDLHLVQYVAGDDPVKMSCLSVRNRTQEDRPITVTGYAEVLLGMNRHELAQHLITSVDESTGALFVRNPWSTTVDPQVVFFDLSGRQDSWTADRLEFLGRQGRLRAPAALIADRPLSGSVGAGLDPCAALQQRVVIPAGESLDFVFTLGAAPDEAGARHLVSTYREQSSTDVLEQVHTLWDRRLRSVQVQAPDSSFDVMMNGWLLYQTLACRMLARSGYYQASGAFGFRDQLQDSMATVLVEPALAREHVLRAASRQFLEGDVQHWWLPATGKGVRTRISDDVVWLAHAVTRYVVVTGDVGVLDEQVPFLEGPLLAEDEHETFMEPEVSDETATLYDHCVIALKRSFTLGAHGLPLMGTGDWNDGMNRVGAQGSGESVWLGWFLHTTLSMFLPLVRARGDADFAARCEAEQARLLEALESHGWDGDWYRRGYFDDGTPLGSSGRSECRIDAIAQSWAVLSGAAMPERAVSAMEHVESELIMHGAGVARLFTPPFDTSDPDPGYIRAYPPGVRENGGQYTHGALWSIFAYAAMDRQDRAGALWSLINPVNHAATLQDAAIYRVEPYVIAADVYSVEPHLGRGGWTWYTGSAGWMYRAGLEAVLGLRREGDALIVQPCLPPEWDEVTVRYRFGSSTYVIVIDAPPLAPRRVARLEQDGEVLLTGDRLPLIDDGAEHHVRVVLEATLGDLAVSGGATALRGMEDEALPER